MQLNFRFRMQLTLPNLYFKSLNERIGLVISAEDMEPITFNSISQAAKSIGVGEPVIRYARKKGKDSFKRTVDGHTKIFSVKFS